MRAHSALVAAVLLIAASIRTSSASSVDDWADITTGIKSTTIPYPNDVLGVPGYFVLQGTTFPVILNKDNSYAVCAAARVGSGRVVVFNKESYTSAACGGTASLCNGPTGKLVINVLRWAGGQPVPSGRRLLAGVTVRLAAASVSAFSSTFFSQLTTAAAAVGVSFVTPTGQTSFTVSNPASLSSGSAAIADVYLTTAHVQYTPAQLSAITAFIQAGGGLVTGGQAWSFSGNISMYMGNQLLAPLNVVQWTADSGDWYPQSVAVAGSPPDPILFNRDLAASALLQHINGAAVLPAATLTAVVKLLTDGLTNKDTPYSAASAALWMDAASSSLAQAVASRSQTWTCGAVVPDDLNMLAVAYMDKLQRDGPASAVTAFPCHTTFPGLPKSGATTVTTTLTVNVTYAGNYSGPMPWRGRDKWHSTGLWAPAGQAVTFTISPALAAGLTASGPGSLSIQIGSHDDDIADETTWCRLPFGVVQRHWFTPGSNVLTAASGLGGLIYLVTEYGNTLGPVSVTVSDAIRAPFYFRGQTSEAEWRATIRNYPAPFAEIGSDKFVMTIPSSAVTNLDNPQEVVEMWDKVLDSMADLAVHSRDRPRAERFVLDCEIGGGGWMHSGYPIMAYLSVAQDLLSVKYGDPIEEDYKWGPFHELGHNHQWSAWTLPNAGETTNNLFTIYALETVMGVPRTARLSDNRATETATYLASGSFATDWKVWTALYTYLQLQENYNPGNYTAGWELYKKILLRYQSIEGTPAVATDSAKINTWVLETSKISGFNLVPFYKTWKFPVSAATEAEVVGLNLAPFNFNPAGACGSVCTDCCLFDGLPDTVVATLTPTNGGPWGDWSGFNQCPGGSWATAMRTRTQPDQTSVGGDNTGLQAVAMTCSTDAGSVTRELMPHKGLLGDWSNMTACPGAHRAVGIMLKVKSAGGDDVAAAAVRLLCSDNTTILDTPGALNLGTWGSSWTRCPANSAICGYKVLFEPDQGTGDDTALNSVTILCCSAPPPRLSPVNCVGSWSAWSTCNATCGGGVLTSTYTVTTPAVDGGTACEAVNGAVRVQTCNTQACPVNCVGSWSAWSNCTATCGGGIQTSTYTITVPASGGGTACEAANGAVKNQTCNTQACSPPHVIVSTIEPNLVGPWGSWSSYKTCPAGSWASGMRTRVEPRNGDNTALNAVTLRCTTPSGVAAGDIQPHAGLWGTWSSFSSCPGSRRVIGMMLRVMPPAGSADDIAADAVRLMCSDNVSTLETVNALGMGNWSSWVMCPANTAVCGIRVKFEPSQGGGDDTALNSITLQCCSTP